MTDGNITVVLFLPTGYDSMYYDSETKVRTTQCYDFNFFVDAHKAGLLPLFLNGAKCRSCKQLVAYHHGMVVCLDTAQRRYISVLLMMTYSCSETFQVFPSRLIVPYCFGTH